MTPSDFGALQDKVDRLSISLQVHTDALAKDIAGRATRVQADLVTRADDLAAGLQLADIRARQDASEARQSSIELELRTVDVRDHVKALAEELKANSEVTQRVEKNTADIVAVFGAIQGGIKVLDFLGNLGAKFLWVTVPAAMLYGAWLTATGKISSWFKP